MLRTVAKQYLPFQPSLAPPRPVLWAVSRGDVAPVRAPSAHAVRRLDVRTCCSSCPSPAPSSNPPNQDYFTITTPLYYVNAAPHMGSAYPTIAADVASRFQRLLGKRVRFLTGTDEHGEKIAAAASGRGLSPQEHCDDIVAQYTDLWDKLDIQYDRFVRTTESRLAELVVDVLVRCWERGDIYSADYEGWYCVDCEEFKGQSESQPRGCPTHRKPCQHRKEANYFFRLSKYSKWIEELLSREDFVQPASRRNELMSYVREGLRDFSISRAAVDWGIRVPQDPKHTVYVWFDALIGYLSGLLPPDVPATTSEVPVHGWPASVHVIGKDILRFHAIYWPGMLLSAGLPLPQRVYGHGFLTKDGLKMGKALGNTLDPRALVAAYGADAVRLYFMKEIVFGQDGDFSEVRFRDAVNAALANNLGNGLNRTLNLLAKFHDRTIPVDASSLPADLPLRQMAAERLPAAASAYSALSFHEAAEAVLALASRSNQYLEETQPWTKLKKGSDEEKAEAAAVLVAVLEAVRIVAVGLVALTPGLSRRIYSQLGFSEEQFQALSWADTAWGGLKAAHRTAEPAPVFVRLEAPGEAEAAAEAAAKAKATAAAAATKPKKAKGGKGAAEDKKAKGGKSQQGQEAQAAQQAQEQAAVV
ncbi:hypothetical protein VOLCADRAFT_58186 [Volvox carteri f. nagariensis]|uniref:methionine--tRNA ligase n=1 Tax=Volvox carteri f. nagariensis TaxID=3068 RepID=D8TPE3_VOLCA|nr:uncharacterized protein VOLCADRAFT_58186 [Volvox carteri f. nagariensis]EFJ50750.1 hypothetical protein VOLCADRAFT_58186 [Volvox carteri f. nagariensis]|eukprot:XP_002948343.1 hypothetical protein VOLCADRAFT_58186 [Volvox carteri f. nagariensis]